MCLSQITFAPLPIPFRRPFKHAAAVRMCAENVMVMVKDTDGRVGFGEGCPRSYVTGETVASAFHFLSRVEGEIRSRVDGPEALERWLDENAHAIDKNPAAFCALELALLDLFARQRNVSLEALVGLGSDTLPLTASAVYGAGGWLAFLAHTAFFSAYGMPDSKLKLTGDPGCDGRRARLLARLGRVRLDANNLWSGWTSAFDGLSVASRYAWAVEEPVQPRDWAGMVRLARAKGLAIVLDESLTLLGDLDAVPAGAEFVLNLRVSKLGGLKRTLRMLSVAKDRGLRVIIGAQVGETSILARAGVVAAAAAGASLAAYEGGYGTWLLKRDAVTPSLRFGHGGRLSLQDAGIESIGTGLLPTAELLSRLGKPQYGRHARRMIR